MSRSDESIEWSEKYRPKTLSQIVSSNKPVSDLCAWRISRLSVDSVSVKGGGTRVAEVRAQVEKPGEGSVEEEKPEKREEKPQTSLFDF